MKKIYEEPEIIVKTFDSGDMVTVSGYEFDFEGYGDEIFW